MTNMIVPIYKPKGCSSYDVIRELKKKHPGQKIGHGGTLDPLASGVLVIGIGSQATKRLSTVLKNTDKEYEALIELGKISATDDSEGPVKKLRVKESKIKAVNINLSATINSFVGEIEQIPPGYSAVKIKGVPAYKRSRRGEVLNLKPKKARINQIEIIEYIYPFLKLKIVCGSGTYIRSLARDIGKKLRTGAYLSELERTRVGQFRADQCVRLKSKVI